MIAYESLRMGVAAFAGRRDVIRVSGPGAFEYLQGQCSQDLDSLEAGRNVASLLLEPDGKLSALVRVTRESEESFLLDVQAGWGETVAVRLRRFKLRSAFDLEEFEAPWVALRGEASQFPMARTDAPAAMIIGETAASGWDGIDFIGETASAQVGESVEWCDAEAFEARRIERGVPVMGAELNERTIAAEAGLVERAVSFTKGCYTGQELIARLDARGNNVARRLRGVVIDDLSVEAATVIGAQLRVPSTEKMVGSITSAAPSPALEAIGALGYVHRSVEVPGILEVILPGATAPTALASIRVLPLA